MPVFLTKKSLTHAFSNLSAQFGTDTVLAMGNAPELVQNAVLTDIAPPKNPAKAETRVLTFLAAINGENGVEPVKLTVKEYSSNDSRNILPPKILEYFTKKKKSDTYNTLYDLKALEVVSVESTKKEFGDSASNPNSPDIQGAKSTPNSENGDSVSVADGPGHPMANNTPSSTISVLDLMNLVNGDAEKYIPKSAGKANEAGTKPIGESPVTGSLATSNSPASMNSIPQNCGNVKEYPGKENLSAAKLGAIASRRKR